MTRPSSFIGILALVLLSVQLPAQTNTALVDPNLVLVNDFEGWGTSLCWWPNVVSGYANRSSYAALAFTTLRLNIVRYNIGGGENPGISNTMEFRAQIPGFEPSPGTWNWSADANQRWMLRQAVALGVNRVEAFANSPPWWMTVSGSVTGSTNGTSNNLQTGSEDAFAVYLATVMSNLTVFDGVTFETVTPLNEPTASWWKYGGRQEGCHISSDQQARLVNLLRSELNSRGLSAGVAASEDNDEQSAINSLNAYSGALTNVARVVSHTYGANNPGGLRNLAAMQLKPLWVSEYGDGDATGLEMARRIHDDIAVLWARGWVYWQFVDNGSGWGCLYNALDGSGNTSYTINKKFYVLGQFSQFIRPGDQIINVSDTNSLAAYNPTNHTLTIVTVNETTNSFTVTYDLRAFGTLPSQAARTRTSPSENQTVLSGASLTDNQFSSLIVPQSVTTHVLTNVSSPLPPSSAPVAWYPFEGNARDASHQGNDGTISGNVQFVPGKLGALAAQFDGVSSYVQIPRSISNHFTISFWVKTTATAATGQWWAGKGLVDGEVNGTVNDFGVALVGSKAALGVGNPDTTLLSTHAINDGQWHHVAVTRNDVTGQMRLYLDGVLDAQTNGPTGTRDAPPALRLASIQAGYSGGFFSGVIDDVQFFSRVFAPGEIASLMNHAPTLAPIANVALLAGQVLSVTNYAADPDLPAQSLNWTALNAPTGATVVALGASNALFSWRPSIAQSPLTSTVSMVVSDTGVPAMSATQSFTINVLRPIQPQLVAPIFNGAGFTVSVDGDSGPDYFIEATTNLAAPAVWQPIFTNFSANPPFSWTDPAAVGTGRRFYRVRLGP